MSIRSSHHLIFSIALFMLAGCNGANESDQQLIGGWEAFAGELPTAVALMNGERVACTMTKVGEKHFLTAAHCVVDKDLGDVRPSFAAGMPLNIRHESGSLKLSIFSTRVPDMYLKNPKATEENSDVAVILANELTPKIPIATLARETLRPTQPVYLSGYGCEDFTDPATERRLKLGKTEVSQVTSWRWVVPAFNPAGEHVQGCPGDSGAALWVLDGTGAMKVAGVNSSIRPLEATLVTRLDSAAPEGLARWLDATLKVEGTLASQPDYSLECSTDFSGGHTPIAILGHGFKLVGHDLAVAPDNLSIGNISLTRTESETERIFFRTEWTQVPQDLLPNIDEIKRATPSSSLQVVVTKQHLNVLNIVMKICRDSNTNSCTTIWNRSIGDEPACRIHRATKRELVALKQTIVRARPQETSELGSAERCRLREGDVINVEGIEYAATPYLRVIMSGNNSRCSLQGAAYITMDDYQQDF